MVGEAAVPQIAGAVEAVHRPSFAHFEAAERECHGPFTLFAVQASVNAGRKASLHQRCDIHPKGMAFSCSLPAFSAYLCTCVFASDYKGIFAHTVRVQIVQLSVDRKSSLKASGSAWIWPQERCGEHLSNACICE